MFIVLFLYFIIIHSLSGLCSKRLHFTYSENHAKSSFPAFYVFLADTSDKYVRHDMHIFPFSATTFPTGKGENITLRFIKRYFTLRKASLYKHHIFK